MALGEYDSPASGRAASVSSPLAVTIDKSALVVLDVESRTKAKISISLTFAEAERLRNDIETQLNDYIRRTMPKHPLRDAPLPAGAMVLREVK